MAVKATRKTLALLSIAVLSGCASRPSIPPAFMHPEHLYLQDEPYSRLYVEIDRVEGANLPEFFVDEIKAFLSAHCQKTEGIEVVMDSPIPVSEVESVPLSAASILCIDGPAADGHSSPAYIHVFVYDGKTAFKQATWNTRVIASCPSTVFWNTDCGRYFPDEGKRHFLRHELGHILGLCQNTDHGDGAHCDTYGCLMSPGPDLLSSLGGMVHLYYREHRLCEDCQRDLELARRAARDDNLSFAGPFLVRQEDGYCVASVPYCDTLVGASAPEEFDWGKALAQAKAGVRQVLREAEKEGRDLKCEVGMASFYDRPMVETDPLDLERDIAVLSKATHDPSILLSRFASRMLKCRQEALAAYRH